MIKKGLVLMLFVSVALASPCVFGITPGDSLFFDGDNFINFPTKVKIVPAGSTQLTAEAWIKPDTMGRTMIIAGQVSNLAGNEYFMVELYNNRIVFLLYPHGFVDRNGIDGSTTAAVELTDQFHHVAAVWDGTNNFKIYLDGVEQEIAVRVLGSGVAGMGFDYTVGSLGFKIGLYPGHWAPRDYIFMGRMQDVRIWSKALTQSEIVDTMNNHISNPPDELVGYWKFDDPVGAFEAVDSSKYHHDGSYCADMKR